MITPAGARYLAAIAKPAKPKRAKPVQHEAKLQKEIVAALRKAFPETWISHTKNNSRNAWAGGRDKALGVLAGMPDLSVVPCQGVTGYIEIKHGVGKLKPEQVKFRDMCLAHGIPHAVAYSVEEAVEAVKQFKGLV